MPRRIAIKRVTGVDRWRRSPTSSPLRSWAVAHASGEGRSDTLYPGLSVYRLTRESIVHKEPVFGVTLGIVVQGRKTVRLHGQDLIVDPTRYIVVTRELQYDGVVHPGESGPYLGVGVTFQPELVAKAIAALADEGRVGTGPPVNAFTAPLEKTIVEPLLRLLQAVDDPVERRAIAPLAAEEIVFRLLRSEAAATLRGFLRVNDVRPITEAMQLMRAQAFRRLSVDDIARQVAMSPSHFAHRFRAVARMSPMRYVKEVRLDAARTLLLGEGARASDVAVRVGYESPAHFTRDFKRRYGSSPALYARQLRDGACA